MAKIQGSVLRTSLDFANAFHQLVLDEESIPVTAFYVNNVLYEYTRLPFGHVTAMNQFCCVMALLCEKLDCCTYYADDLMVLTQRDALRNEEQIFDQHLDDIRSILARIIQAGLKLKAHKSNWCYGADRPLDWLGYTLENNLLKPQEAKLEVVRNTPTPTTKRQALSLVSFFSYYRRFVPQFAKIAKDIYDAANAEEFVWTAQAEEAAQKIRDILCSDAVLRLPRQGEPFLIYTDASHIAIGVVLCQIDPVDGLEHPCAFGSRKFNDSELKLSTPCKELLAIIYALTLWSFYLCGNAVHIFSDCRAWTFLKLQSGVSGKIARTALLVQEYDITISYIPGTKNKAADGLSRAFDVGESCDDQSTARHPALEKLSAAPITEGEVMKLDDYLEQCESYLATAWPKLMGDYEREQEQSALEPKQLDEEAQYVEHVLSISSFYRKEEVESRSPEVTIAASDLNEGPKRRDRNLSATSENSHVSRGGTEADSECLTEEIVSDSSSEVPRTSSDFPEVDQYIMLVSNRLVAINDSCFSFEAFKEAQDNDVFCRQHILLIKKKDPEIARKGYYLKRGLLMRTFVTNDGQKYSVVCVPKELVQSLLESTHRSLLCGHHGSQKYLIDMSRKYYWKGMKKDVETFQRSCYACQLNDKYPVRITIGQILKPLFPMHIVHYDLVVGLPKSLDGSHAIILFYDGFSRHVFGIPLASEKAEYIVKKIMSHYVAAFGLPWALHSDNGKNIDGNLVRHLAAMLGVVKTSTPSHTPRANPCETMCGAVTMLIRKALTGSDQRYWAQCLPFVLNALNNTVHTATGYTPNSLFLGRFQERPLVPLVPFHVESANVNEYYKKMRRFQELAYQIARVRNEARIAKRKSKFDKTAKKPKYEVGGYVMIKNLNPASGPGKMKLRAKYIGPFRIIKVYPACLAIIPWSEENSLEQYLADPDLFRLVTRGKVRPFHVRTVSVKDCKPYRGKLNQQVDIVDPIMLDKFLRALDVDCNVEIESVVVDDFRKRGADPEPPRSDRKSRASCSTDLDTLPPDDDDDGGDDDGDDGGDDGDEDGGYDPEGDGAEPDPHPDGNPDDLDDPLLDQDGGLYDDMPDLEDPPADSQEDPEEDHLEHFDVTPEQRRQMVDLLSDDELSQASSGALHRHNRLVDLLRAARGADDRFRRQAEDELARAMESMERRDGEGQAAHRRDGRARSEMSWEEDPELGPDVPEGRVDDSRRRTPEHEETRATVSDIPSVAPRRRVREWIDESSTAHPAEEDSPIEDVQPLRSGRIPRPMPRQNIEPVITRSGRVSKPPQRYDPGDYKPTRGGAQRLSPIQMPSTFDDPAHQRFFDAGMDLLGAEIEEEVDELMRPLGGQQRSPQPGPSRSGNRPVTSTPTKASEGKVPSFYFGTGRSGHAGDAQFRPAKTPSSGSSPTEPEPRLTRSAARRAATEAGAEEEPNPERGQNASASKSTRTTHSKTSKTTTRTKR